MYFKCIFCVKCKQKNRVNVKKMKEIFSKIISKTNMTEILHSGLHIFST